MPIAGSRREHFAAGAMRLPDSDDLDYVLDAVGNQWDALRGRHVFLTGGTGFVGKWLLAALLHANRRRALDCRVTVLTRDAGRFVTHSPELASAPLVTLLEGDVRSFDCVAVDIDHVIHAATDVMNTPGPLGMFETCVTGTRRVLELALRTGAKSTLLVSSGAVYGRQPPGLHAVSESHAGGPDPMAASAGYAEGKRASEWLAAAYGAEFGLPVKVARCFAFVGPYLPLDRHFAIGNFMRDALEGRPIEVRGDGSPVRSYLYAADMAAWLWLILLAGRAATAYNVGSNEAVDLLAVARMVADLAGSTAGITVRELRRQALAERYVPDVERARNELGVPPPLALRAAIDRTLRWHRPRDSQRMGAVR